MIIKSGYTTCNTCDKFAYITSATTLGQLPDGYDGELCPQCNMWVCALDKLEPEMTKTELYKDFHIPYSILKREYKAELFRCRWNPSAYNPREWVRHFILLERVKFLEKKMGVAE